MCFMSLQKKKKRWVECSPMVRQTWVQSQVVSCQRLLKWYLIPPRLTLSNIKLRSKGKVEQSWERSSTLPYTSVQQLLKRKPSGHPRLRQPTILKPAHWPRGQSVCQWPGRLGFSPRSRHTKDLEMVLDTSLLNTQQYKVRTKGKVEQSRERSSASPYTSLQQLLKKEAFGTPSTTVANFTFFFFY